MIQACKNHPKPYICTHFRDSDSLTTAKPAKEKRHRKNHRLTNPKRHGLFNNVNSIEETRMGFTKKK